MNNDETKDETTTSSLPIGNTLVGGSPSLSRKRVPKFKVWLPYRQMMIRPKDIIEIQESQISGITIGQMKEWVWLQFRGFVDITNTEIYDGDIVKDRYGRIMQISEWNFKPCFIALTETNFHHADFFDWMQRNKEGDLKDECDVEIIGNIYDNPELLRTVQQ